MTTSPSRIRVALAVPDEELRRTLVSAFDDELELAGQGDSLAEALADSEADVVILQCHGDAALHALSEFIEDPEAPPVTLLVPEEEGGLLRRALACGAREFLLDPIQPRAVRRVLRRAGERSKLRREARAQARAQARVEGPGTRARVWGFLGATGGAGRTTTLLGLANELLLLGGRVVVADLNPVGDDVGFYLGLAPGPPDVADMLAAAADDPNQLAGERPGEYLMEHPSGLRVLVGPEDWGRGEGMDMAALPALVSALSAGADHLLLDLPPGAASALRPVLALCHDLVVVGGDGAGPRKNLHALARHLQAMDLAGTLHLTLAGYQESRAPQAELRKQFADLDLPIEHVFPDDRAAADGALRAGQPVTRVLPETRLAQAIRGFAAHLTRPEASP